MSALFETPWILVECSEPSTVCVRLNNAWNGEHSAQLPDWDEVARAFSAVESAKRLVFDAQGLAQWDSLLPGFLLRICELARARDIFVDLSALPEGLRKIVELALAVPRKEDAQRDRAGGSWLYRLGEAGIRIWEGTEAVLNFAGEIALSVGRLLRGKARFRWRDVWFLIQKCGPEALPIVTLISFLVGMILAYVGVVQLEQFGATIYVANLVGIAMMREMGAVMSGVIMSGRTGAAFAAELGSMKVSEEISAFRTFGISPFDFLILPRICAVVVMMPLLVLYADIMGILGGGLVAVSMGLTPLQYGTQIIHAVDLGEFSAGLIKSVFFGAIIGFTGCLRGMQSGNSSESVGRVTTSAVVTSITWIIVADAVFAVLFNVFGL